MFLVLNPVAFQLGNLSVKWYGIFMTTSVLAVTTMTIIEDKKRQIVNGDSVDPLFWTVPIGFMGARTYYAIFEWGYFSQHPDQIIAIWNGEIAIYGGLLAGLVVPFIFCRNRMLPPLLIFDIITPGVLAAQILGRWGSSMNQEVHGTQTSLTFLQSLHLPEFVIKQMHISGHYHQPTFLYEFFSNFIGLILILVFRYKEGLFKRGEVFASYTIWYSTVHSLTEGVRTDSLCIFSMIRVSQTLSLILFIAAIILVTYRRKQGNVAWYLNGSGLKFSYER